jgi:urease accessory protein
MDLTATTMRHKMASPADLLRLMTWLSPTFPVGSFSYSHGLEWAISSGAITDGASLTSWLTDLAERGGGWNDMVVLTAAWRGEEVAELVEAMAPSAERHLETMQLGEAFAAATVHWTVNVPRAPYPVAVGVVCGRSGIGIEATLVAWLHSFLANLVSVAVRLIPLGQVEGLAVLRNLEPAVLAAARRASVSRLDDLGGATFVSDIASMKHEMQHMRVFRT